MQGNSSALYLLNRLAGPVRFTTRFSVSSSPDFTTLRVRAGSSTLAEVHLDSERETVQVELPPVSVAAGGHDRDLRTVSPGTPAARIHDVEIGAEPCAREGLVLGLPFDLYQRYRLASQVCFPVDPGSHPRRGRPVGGPGRTRGHHGGLLLRSWEGTGPSRSEPPT